MTIDSFNSLGGYSVNIPSTLVIDQAGNVVANVLTTGNVSATNINATNLISGTFLIQSVVNNISASGTTQSTATNLVKSINVVSTVSSGTGVSLPTAVAGYRITVMNTSANALNVYPLGNGTINDGSANVAYPLPAGTRLDFICIDTVAAPGGKWYTL